MVACIGLVVFVVVARRFRRRHGLHRDIARATGVPEPVLNVVGDLVVPVEDNVMNVAVPVVRVEPVGLEELLNDEWQAPSPSPYERVGAIEFVPPPQLPSYPDFSLPLVPWQVL